MQNLAQDPIINVIHNGIKRGIRVALENNCFMDAVILIYSGIDSMAYLGMPETQNDVTRSNFVDWSNDYLRLPGPHAPSGLEFYAARCGVVHSHSASSSLYRDGQVRMLFYMSECQPPVRFNPEVDSSIVFISVPALANAFFQGIDRFLIDVFKDPVSARIANSRFENILHTNTLEELDLEEG